MWLTVGWLPEDRTIFRCSSAKHGIPPHTWLPGKESLRNGHKSHSPSSSTFSSFAAFCIVLDSIYLEKSKLIPHGLLNFFILLVKFCTFHPTHLVIDPLISYSTGPESPALRHPLAEEVYLGSSHPDFKRLLSSQLQTPSIVSFTLYHAVICSLLRYSGIIEVTLSGRLAWISTDTMWKPSERLMETIRHYASFPATGVSLRQMVQFGDRPSTGVSISCPLKPIGVITMTRGLFVLIAWPRFWSRDSFSRLSIPLRGTPNSTRSPCPGPGGTPWWTQRNALYQEGPGLVCAIVRGMTHRPLLSVAHNAMNPSKPLPVFFISNMK